MTMIQIGAKLEANVLSSYPFVIVQYNPESKRRVVDIAKTAKDANEACLRRELMHPHPGYAYRIEPNKGKRLL